MKALLDAGTVRFVGYFFRAYPGRTAVMIGLLILAGIAEGVGLVTLLPLLEFGTGDGEARSALTQRLVEGLAALGLDPGLGILLLIIVVMIILKAFFVWLAMRQVGFTVARVATELRLRVIRAVVAADWRFFLSHPTGYFANAVGTEASRAANGYQTACQSVAGLIQVAIYLCVVVLISWQVAVAALLLAPIVLYSLRRFVAMSREAGAEQTRVKKDLIRRITEVLPGMKAIKAMGRERAVLPFLERETKEYNRAQEKSIHAAESLKAFQEPAIVAVLAAGLYGTVTLGSAPPATVLVAALLFYRVMTTANNLQRQYQQITDKESAFWSLMGTIERAEAAREVPSAHRGEVPHLREEIRFEDVWFAYDEMPVLRKVDIVIPAGDLVVFTGVSGAGKSTLVDLISGLLLPNRGSVSVDGVPTSELDLSAWRSMIGYVPQEMLLFHDTILRNVTLGNEEIEREVVVSALKAAGAWEFVAEHPDGLERIVGERGSQLSGGQRQRIGIARAIAGRPSLLILDEATTGLDPESEALVCDALARLKGEMTMVAISHQPAIRQVSDRVYDVERGRACLREPEVPLERAQVPAPSSKGGPGEA